MKQDAAFFREAFRGVHDAVVIGNTKGEVEYMNPAAAALTGHSADDLQTIDLWELVPEAAGQIRRDTAGRCDQTALTLKNDPSIKVELSWNTLKYSGQRHVKLVFRTIDGNILSAFGEELRNLFSSVFEHIPDQVFIKDRHYRMVVCNQATAINLGEDDPDKTVGKCDYDFLEKKDADTFRVIENEILNNGRKMVDIEEEYINARNKACVLLSTKVPLRNLRGEIIGLVGINRDISERKHAEKELNYERGLFRSLMDNSNDYIYFKDLQSRFLRCSLAQIQHFQAQDITDLLGKTDDEFYSGEHSGNSLRDEQEIIRTGKPVIGKVEKETWPDGRVTWVLTSKMPFRDEHGKIIGTFGISKDITEIKEAELKLEKLHRQLLDASRQAGMAEVSTSVLHNIGNVLNSVNVSSLLISETVGGSKVSSLPKVVALLQSHADDLPAFFTEDSKGRQLPGYLEQLAAYLQEEQETVLREVETLTTNIQHIKEVISMQQSCASMVGLVETLPVADMVEDALRLNVGAVERHGIELVREYAPVPPVSVEKHKVLQVLVNLIRNAKYACDDSGRQDKRITLRITQGKGRVLISVEDNGVGIAQENLIRIFSHGFTTRKEGHGFGLHSGALAAKELGGALKVSSEGPGQGAVFTFELPIEAKRKQ